MGKFQTFCKFYQGALTIIFQVYSDKKLKKIWLNFFSSFSSRPSLLYSQLSPCGRHAITTTPLIRTPSSLLRTATKSPCENYRHLTETNSRYYGLSLLRTYGHLSRSRQQKFCCSNFRQNGYKSASFDIQAQVPQIITYFFLFFSSSLSLWLKSEHSASRLT